MRILLFTLAVSSALVVNASVIPSEIRVNTNQDAEWEIYNDAWLVKREDNDHITYKRRPSTTELQHNRQTLLFKVSTTEKPCTTPFPVTEAPTTQRPRTRAPEVRSRTRSSQDSSSSSGVQPKSLSTSRQTTDASPAEGNYWWMVSHRSDNRITYTRRSNSTSAETTTEKASTGQLRRLGHGDDSVVARVVDLDNDDLLTEEDILQRGRNTRLQQRRLAKSGTRRNQAQVQPAVQESSQPKDARDGYPRIGEEHNGWVVVGKTHDQISWERVKDEADLHLEAQQRAAADAHRAANLRLRSSDLTNVQNELDALETQQYISHNVNTDDDVDGDIDSSPRVGDVENGWRVIKKRKNHITWEKVEQGTTLTSRTLTGENQLGGSLSNSASQTQSQSQTSQFGVHEVESYPRVGDIVEGWRVMSKSNDHITWAKVGTENESDAAAEALRNQQRSANLQLRSGDRVHWRNTDGTERVFPRTRGGSGSEEFPNEFETYSRSTNPNFPQDSLIGGTVRTSNSSSWNIGDELHGWKVIGKDYRGIIWEKIKNETETVTARPTPRPRLQVKSGDGIRRRGSNLQVKAITSPPTTLHQVSNGEFVRYLHPDGQERWYPKLRETTASNANNLQISKALEGSNINSQTANKTDSAVKVATDPKRIGWYLAKETRNSITWQKDDVDPNAVYNHNDFPQIGHEQTGWKVSNKTRHHISWRRVGTDHLGSEEEIPSQ